MTQRGLVSWETAVAVVGGLGSAAAVIGYLIGPARWGGDVEARLRGVEQSTVRIEAKVDQILLQRVTKP